MDYEKYRVSVTPAIEKSTKSIEFEVATSDEAASVEHAISATLLFIQDDIKAMKDYSNMIYIEGLVDGEWEEIADGDL